jgi:hypothetical protein
MKYKIKKNTICEDSKMPVACLNSRI